MSDSCALRAKMEKLRIELKEELNIIKCELVKINGIDIRTEQYQRLKSKERNLIREINKLTIGIKELQEIDGDPKIKAYLDETFEKIESGEITMDQIKQYQENLVSSMENDDFDELFDDTNTIDLLDATDKDIQNEIDNLLGNL